MRWTEAAGSSYKETRPKERRELNFRFTFTNTYSTTSSRYYIFFIFFPFRSCWSVLFWMLQNCRVVVVEYMTCWSWFIFFQASDLLYFAEWMLQYCADLFSCYYHFFFLSFLLIYSPCYFLSCRSIYTTNIVYCKKDSLIPCTQCQLWLSFTVYLC